MSASNPTGATSDHDLFAAAQAVNKIGIAVLDELDHIGEHKSCILGSAVLVDVLTRNGYPAAHAVTVRAQVANPVLNAWRKEHGFPTDPDGQRKCEAAGGRMVFLGTSPTGEFPKDRWPGHLAVIVPHLFGGRHALCDVTIPQVNVPAWQIELPPLLARVRDEFVKGECDHPAEANGSLIVMRAFPADRTFETSDLWTNQARRAAIVTRVLARH